MNDGSIGSTVHVLGEGLKLWTICRGLAKEDVGLRGVVHEVWSGLSV